MIKTLFQTRTLQDFPTQGRAPDILKLMAAIFMVGDHINAILLDGAYPLLWIFGRTVFPLFCFVVALHVSRGIDGKTYLLKLLPFALLAQIPHTWALWEPVMESDWNNFFFNVIFTLGFGALIAPQVLRLGRVFPFGLLPFGLLVVAVVGDPIFDIVEFGAVGLLLPAAFLMLIKSPEDGALPAWLFLLACLFFVNYSFESIGFGTVFLLLYIMIAVVYTGLFLLFVYETAKMKEGKRFLPRYFLHIFYPAHFVILGVLAVFLA